MAEPIGEEMTEIIIEQDDDEAALDVPPDRRRVKTEKSDLPVDTIFGWVSRGKINPQPDFQRFYVWKLKQVVSLSPYCWTSQFQ